MACITSKVEHGAGHPGRRLEFDRGPVQPTGQAGPTGDSSGAGD